MVVHATMPAADRQTPAPGGQSPPPAALDGTILLTGLTFLGRPVTRVVIEWEGGRLDTHLPVPEPPDGPALSRIVERLAASPVPLSRKQLAKVLELKGAGGRFNQNIRHLLETGGVHERDGLLTDDVTKFDD